jgi:hypothetical protein
MFLMEATVNPRHPGSRLDADHPENGVLIPCRITVATPAARQNRSKRPRTSSHAASMPLATIPADVLSLFMALLYFVNSTPRAYRLKVGNADLPIPTNSGSTSCKLTSACE